ncbi:hypothetical protein D3C76_1442760 [compost metagenome]
MLINAAVKLGCSTQAFEPGMQVNKGQCRFAFKRVQVGDGLAKNLRGLLITAIHCIVVQRVQPLGTLQQQSVVGMSENLRRALAVPPLHQ